MNFNVVILAGGSGSRLWPVSRSSYPKQFLPLVSEKTMLQETVERVLELNPDSVTTICNEDHRFHVAAQLNDMNINSSIILEPYSRNTAPAIALAALNSEDDSLLLVLPADHVINDTKYFINSVKKAKLIAESNKLVTFGINPTSPETGYGYIKKGNPIQEGFEVDAFIEKPPLTNAKEYLNQGGYYWNSGMFLFSKEKYLSELRNFQPDIYNNCLEAFANKSDDLDYIRIDKNIFKKCPNISVDYAVMEKTDSAVLFPLEVNWSDIGSWKSLWETIDKDNDGNVKIGDVKSYKSNNSFIKTENILLTTLGIKDLVIVATKDAILVADKECSQEIRLVTENLKQENRDEVDLHREISRPWGRFDSLESNDGSYQVKKITVNPGEKLSIQSHEYRAEHWIVVEGTAHVTCDDKTFPVSRNESTYIPLGAIHSLENKQIDKLILIEVQIGSYLGEDDIVRYKDNYGRV